MCEIVIDPERLKHFPRAVPMNIREAVLILSKAVSRILTERKTQKAMAATDEQNEPEEKNQESAPAPAPAKRHGPHAEIIFMKSRSPKKNRLIGSIRKFP